MVGFWQEDTPIVIQGRPNVFENESEAILATCYVNKAVRRTVIAIASWAHTSESITLTVNDWANLGMSPTATKNVSAPFIGNFQQATVFGTVTSELNLPAIKVDPARGWLVIVEQV